MRPRAWTRLLTLVVLLVAGAASAVAGTVARPSASGVRILRIRYIAHDGLTRSALVVVPKADATGGRGLPLVISPHGRDSTPLENARLWGDLPALGGFAVVSPEGQGRRLTLDSWGDPGQVEDLARMPAIVGRALPRLSLDPSRVFAVGDSMGGQEVLLLVARDPSLLSGAVAFDATANLALRYDAFSRFSPRLKALMTHEVGGSPSLDPHAYAIRSPLHWAARLALSGVPIELWWSRRDRVVHDPGLQSALLFRRILELNPGAPVEQYVGYWQHGVAMEEKLPTALRQLGLLPPYRLARSGWGGTVVVGHRPPRPRLLNG